MASIWEKLSTLVKSNIHGLLDKAIDLNSPEAIKQYVRDLEDALREMRGALASSIGNVTAARQRVASIQAKITATEEGIEALISDDDTSNDHFADPLGAKLVGYERDVEAAKEELAALELEQTALQNAEDQLEDKVEEMQGQVARLAALARKAAVQERAAASISSAAAALGMNGAVSVDNIEERIQARSAAAGARLGMAMGELDGAGGAEAAVKKAAGSSKVAEIRARMAAAKAAAGASA